MQTIHNTLIVDFNRQAEKWRRNEPKTSSDFIVRTVVFDIFQKIGKDKVALDLGCGEGFFSRKMATIARKVIGVDISKKMLEFAVKQEKEDHKAIEYYNSDVRNMSCIQEASIELCVGNFITGYIEPDDLPIFYIEISRVLNGNGLFILSMPHPALYLLNPVDIVTSFQKDDYAYFQDRGKCITGLLPTTQGACLEVGMFHSTLEDHFTGISAAGLAVTQIIEPKASPEITQKFPLFRGLENQPLFMIIVGIKIS